MTDGDQPSSQLSLETASMMLRMGVARRRPVDRLIDRLERAGGAAWLDVSLANGPLAGLGAPGQILTGGKTSLDMLRTIKDRAKELVSRAEDGDERLAGVAGYFLSIAAAMRFYDEVITSRPREEIATLLLDLATAIPEPYSTMCARAAVR